MLRDMNKIDTVIFDVGWVLVHLDFAPLLTCLAAAGVRHTMPEIIAAIDLHAHERGELNGMRLIENLQGLAPGLDRAQLKDCWLNMFEPVAPMFELARRLTRSHRVHLLSNVGDLHWAHLDACYQLHSLGHGALPSFEAGVMKPHPAIYRLAESRFALDPARTVFIDDLEPNVQAARECGWRAIQHQDYAATLTALRELGVD